MRIRKRKTIKIRKRPGGTPCTVCGEPTPYYLPGMDPVHKGCASEEVPSGSIPLKALVALAKKGFLEISFRYLEHFDEWYVKAWRPGTTDVKAGKTKSLESAFQLMLDQKV